jgi:antitoxin (DNA-binding transcriptional repressor) of toxin-antitoxin stability system
MPITASALRADVYRVLDRAISSGEPVEIERNGVIVRLVPPSKGCWLDRLPRREGVVAGDSADLANVHWFEAWKPGPL